MDMSGLDRFGTWAERAAGACVASIYRVFSPVQELAWLEEVRGATQWASPCRPLGPYYARAHEVDGSIKRGVAENS